MPSVSPVSMLEIYTSSLPDTSSCLAGSLVGTWKSLDVLLNLALVPEELTVCHG